MDEGCRSGESPARRFHLLLLVTGVGLLIWSGINPRDRVVWILEVAPILIGGTVLLATYRRFPLSNLVYFLIWCHSAILVIGGHWTYADNPIFDAIQDAWGLPRNYYDRLGHIAEGFVPAMIAREVLLRTSPLRRGKWLFAIVICICLAIAAGYEFFEWWTAVATGDSESAVQFLATQGDPWDTHWDMFLCLCGAVASLIILPRAHDRSMSGHTMPPRTRILLFLLPLGFVLAAILACHFLSAS
jgi:putative membrane protein